SKTMIKIIILAITLYLFLCSISLMGASFKSFGKDFAETLIQTTNNPFVGLMIGVLVTSIIQSSSTTTSIVVGFVAAGVLTVRNAVPIVMGANIGTTVTNTLVAVAHVTRKEEFKRALNCSCLHDFFNLMAVIILFPIEMSTHILERSAQIISSFFSSVDGVAFSSPVKIIIKPTVNAVKSFIHTIPLSEVFQGIVLLVLSLSILFLALYILVKIMKGLVVKRTEIVFDKVLGKGGVFAMFMGMLFTAFVQSSSITTSLLVPIAGAGLLPVERLFPITLGANIGTTITALLASLAGNQAALTIALVHLLFNIAGILIIYPIKTIRKIPLFMAKVFAATCYKKAYFAFIYIFLVFFALPGLLIFISRNFF
ncbi:Na/Pi symporter, partial [Chlamydiota bacterium]